MLVSVFLVSYSKVVLNLVQFEAKDSGVGHTCVKSSSGFGTEL